jgi:hypothetical protein
MQGVDSASPCHSSETAAVAGPENKGLLPVYRKEPNWGSMFVENLVCAAGKERHQHHEVGQGEQPLVRLFAGGFRSPRDKAQMAALRKIANVIDANSSQACNLCVGKNLLARFYGDHGLVPLTVCHTARLLLAPKSFDAICSVRDAPFVEQ